MINSKSEYLLKKQESLDNRLRKEQFKASRDAQAKGLGSSDRNFYVSQRLHDYKKVELVRRAVKDVKSRG